MTGALAVGSGHRRTDAWVSRRRMVARMPLLMRITETYKRKLCLHVMHFEQFITLLLR